MKELWQLFISFAQVGLFGLGGGNSMIQLIEEECVRNRAWVSSEEYGTLIGVNFLFPGLTAVKLAGFIGLKVGGVPGLVTGVVALNLPGLALSMLFYTFIVSRQDLPVVKKLLVAMQYGALALLGAALLSLAKPLTGPSFSWTAALLAVALFAAVGVFKLSSFISLAVFTVACLLLL